MFSTKLKIDYETITIDTFYFQMSMCESKTVGLVTLNSLWSNFEICRQEGLQADSTLHR